MENSLRTTDKVQELQKKLYLKAKSDAKFRFYALYDKVCRRDVMQKAWARVKKNKGVAGIDAETIEDIENSGVEAFIKRLQEELQTKEYRPQQTKRVNIPKPDGKQRPLSIPTVKDRVVQSALKIIIEPIFEADFDDCSYGFRPKRSGQQAVEEVRKYLNYGYKQIIETDIEDCFGTIPHRELLNMIAKRIVDGKILWLIKMFLKAGTLEEKEPRTPKGGTPQGGVISPLLANIYLDNIDKGWKPISRTAHLIRYADDLVIMTKYKAQGYKIALDKIVRGLKLKLKYEKTRIVNAEEEPFDFLGYTFTRVISKRSRMMTTYYFASRKAERAIMAKIRKITNWQRPIKVEQVIKELKPALRGWVNYFRRSNSSKKFSKVRYYAAQKVRKFMRRRRQKAGYGYKEYPDEYLYGKLGLYNNYRVCWTKAS